MIVESPVGVELLTCHQISFDSIKSQKWIATNTVYFENQKISSKCSSTFWHFTSNIQAEGYIHPDLGHKCT
jgi:hypothetical protein